ncbi:hypothetical protein ACQ86N_03410 [Puia sp. P3]|uniref:hypothetical protein n=1 Tax=Puia sp. P3 TaxID=3423952 RepID=UPI003D66495E
MKRKVCTVWMIFLVGVAGAQPLVKRQPVAAADVIRVRMDQPGPKIDPTMWGVFLRT